MAVAQDGTRSAENNALVDDEAWVDRLRRTVADGVPAAAAVAVDDEPGEANEPDATPDWADDALADAPSLANALRDLERRVSAVDIRLRQLNEEWDRLVVEVADAVVARLDERWRTLSD